MRKFRALLLAAASALLSASAFAASVTIQVIQHDNGSAKVCEGSFVLEDTVISQLFDRGCIVSNIKALAWDEAELDSRTFARSLDEAMAGFADYFVQIDVFYSRAGSRNPEAVLLSNISHVSWKAVSTYDRGVVSSGKLMPKKVDESKNNADGIIDFANEISLNIVKGLSRK